MLEASGRIGLVGMLIVVTRRAARNRNSVQSMAAHVLFTLAIAAMFNPLQWVALAGGAVLGRCFATT